MECWWGMHKDILSLAIQNKMYLWDTKSHLASKFKRINCHVPKESPKVHALSIKCSSSNFTDSILYGPRVSRGHCLMNRITNGGCSQKAMSEICPSPTLPWFTFHKYSLRNMFLHIFIHVTKPRTGTQTLWLIQESIKPPEELIWCGGS